MLLVVAQKHNPSKYSQAFELLNSWCLIILRLGGDIALRENIFNISQPERYRCQVYRYHNALSRMTISVYKDDRPQPAFYLLFVDVGYFSGPMAWQGAHFNQHPANDCLSLMVRAGLVTAELLSDPAIYDYFTQTVHLYAVETGAAQVRIIAGRTSLLQTLPSED